MFHIFHKWSPWQTIQEGLLTSSETGNYIGIYITQTRSCKVCGKVEIHNSETY